MFCWIPKCRISHVRNAICHNIGGQALLLDVSKVLTQYTIFASGQNGLVRENKDMAGNQGVQILLIQGVTWYLILQLPICYDHCARWYLNTRYHDTDQDETKQKSK